MLRAEPSKGPVRPVVEWERGIGAAETHAAGPVRVIPVTVAMQEADRLREQMRGYNPVASAWRAQALGGRAVQQAPAPVSRLRLMGMDMSSRHQSMQPCGCGRRTPHSTGKCWHCRKQDAREKAEVR